MNEYQVRYTCSGEQQLSIVNFITHNAKEYIIAREFATREHIQCYVKTDITKKTWVNKFNLNFKGMDRRDKYVMEDKGQTKLYVCKGDTSLEQPDIIAKSSLFTDEDIKNFHDEYWHNHNKLTEMPDVISASTLQPIVAIKTKKQRKPPFMMEVKMSLENDYPLLEWGKEHKALVFKRVMFMLGDYCKALDHIIVTRMVYGIMNSLIKDRHEWLEHWYLKCFGEQYEDVNIQEEIEMVLEQKPTSNDKHKRDFFTAVIEDD